MRSNPYPNRREPRKRDEMKKIPTYKEAREAIFSDPPTYTDIDELINRHLYGPRGVTMQKISDKELEMLEQVVSQARPNKWLDFAGNGKSQRTHIGYSAEANGQMVTVPLFETNAPAKRADVLLAVYARNYLPALLAELREHRTAEHCVERTNAGVPLSEGDSEADEGGVFARKECLFNYCPNPGLCRVECMHPAKSD